MKHPIYHTRRQHGLPLGINRHRTHPGRAGKAVATIIAALAAIALGLVLITYCQP